MAIFPEVGSRFTKYYFAIGDDSVSARSVNITVSMVAKRTVFYKEPVKNGFSERYRTVAEDSSFDGEVVSSPWGLSVITSKGAVYAKKQAVAYLDKRVEMRIDELNNEIRRAELAKEKRIAELAKAEKLRDMVKEATWLMEPVLEEA